MKKMKSAIRKSIGISLCVGLCVSITMMYIRWKHNPQQEFHSNTHIDLVHFLGIGAGWVVVVSVTVFLITVLPIIWLNKRVASS